jgi:monofunctional biosynthetic peptidoglycan transglycosylase
MNFRARLLGPIWPPLARLLGLTLLALLGLQLYFAGRIALMGILAPESTSFQRSEIWRLAQQPQGLRWRQTWVPQTRISDQLKRAVIVSEDDIFARHDETQASRSRQSRAPKVVGGSTITQQLAKNLFLSGERTLLRKGQEFVLTLMLEAMLSKRRILEIYLNHVEWGEGVFGAEAAARHYFNKPAAELSGWEASRLAVMLPRPRYFEKLPQSAYLQERAEVIQGRLGGAVLPAAR